MFKSKKKQIKEIKELQKQSLQKTQDDYMIGLYNGLEIAVAILENREPTFLSCVSKQHKCIENEEEIETGRTIFSGKRKC